MPTKPNTLSEEERKAGWTLLFDGKSTRGWRGYKKKDMPATWKVAGGALVLEKKAGAEGGDIVTVAEYDRFELALEWRISPGGNSGIMYHVQESEPYPWQTGPEVQVLDNAKHADGKNPLTSAGSCYGLYAPEEDVTKPVGQWNQVRLVVRVPVVEHWLNGDKLLEYELGSADWNQRVAASKFKAFPNFGKAPKGFIALQDHGDHVEYRSIKLLPLPPAK